MGMSFRTVIPLTVDAGWYKAIHSCFGAGSGFMFFTAIGTDRRGSIALSFIVIKLLAVVTTFDMVMVIDIAPAHANIKLVIQGLVNKVTDILTNSQ